MPQEAYFLGLDLGKKQDYSCLTAVHQLIPDGDLLAEAGGGVEHAVYTVRGLKRWRLGTPYPVVVKEVTDIVASGPLAGATLGVDRGGVGQAVCDLLVQQQPNVTLYSICSHNGNATVKAGMDIRIPKRELIGALTVVLETNRLAIPNTIQDRQQLDQELRNFRYKISKEGAETLEAAREADHDDTVTSLAIALWLGRYIGGGKWVNDTSPNTSIPRELRDLQTRVSENQETEPVDKRRG
jgi:hypothetical protein